MGHIMGLSNPPPLTYIIGASRAGKTTYAKKMAKRYGLYYLSFDSIWNYQRSIADQWDSFIGVVKTTVKERGPTILDGMMHGGIVRVPDDFPDAQLLIMYADFDIMLSRQRDLPWCESSINDYMVTYYQLNIDHNPCFVMSNDEFTHPSPEEFFAYIGDPYYGRITEWLIQEIDSMKGDPTYSPIQLGSTIRPGYERAVETLDKIKGLVNWNDAAVLEYGPHLAYAALHFYSTRAKSVQLVEQSASASNAVSKMAHFLGRSNIEVFQQDIMDYEVTTQPDIVLCLNMFYGLKDKARAAAKLWEGSPSHIIVETNTEDFPFLNREATERGYGCRVYAGRTNCSGHDRMIGHYYAIH
jgi:hypothetical protein